MKSLLESNLISRVGDIPSAIFCAMCVRLHACSLAGIVRIIGLGPIYYIKSQRPIINVKDNNTTSGFKREISQLK